MADACAVELTDISKSYPSGIRAVSNLSMSVRREEIYGFIGRNGAGKTTTMRMLVGLIRPSSGSGRVLGRPLGDPGALARVGSLIEGPAFYPYLSGRDNLRLLARYLGVADAAVGPLLDRVGLGDRADSRFRTYSLGMKQRLGVAAALLGDPELLILDEPTNGLDPAGMAAIRDLLRALCDQGRTVLLSSHLLGEVEQVCDRVGIVHEGRLVVEGTLAQIQAGAGGRLLIRAEPAGEAATRLRQAPGVAAVNHVGDGLEVVADPARAGELNALLTVHGIVVNELRVVQRSLEDVFLGLTGEPEGAAEPAGTPVRAGT